MRRAGRIVAEVLALVEAELRPGVSTRWLDEIAERHMRANGAIPSFKGYLGGARYGDGPGAYPASICVSLDDEVVHGIPGDRTVASGQVVSVDAGCSVDGWHGDAARTWIVGETGPEVRQLVETTRQALLAGAAAAVVGNRVGDVSGAVQDVAEAAGFGIVRQFVGHGIGTDMHEPPQIPNYRSGSAGMRLEPGHTLAIEPMLTLGDPEVAVLADGWTVATVDGSLAAHFEDTVAVTEDGPVILTAP
jgi:methionyl aminopeptidase